MPLSSLRRGLARNLVLTYVLLALLVGGLLTAVSIFTVTGLEAHLQRIDMGMAVQRVRTEYLAGQDPGRPSRFFHGVAGSEAFPAWLRELPPGFHKVDHDGRVWHAMVDDKDGDRYMLLRDYTDYERSQRGSHWLAVGGMAGGLLVAFGLGALMIRRVVAPLARLARQVQGRPGQPPRTRLAQDYPANEIGALAAAFDATYNQLEQALERERLFTADVGHELRTPLMAITSSCELLRDDPALGHADLTALARIERAAADMRQRLDVYLMLARGRDSAQNSFEQASAQVVARDQAAVYGPLAERRGMTLRLVTDGPLTPYYPVPLLRAVLGNLIQNALQYAGPGATVTLAVRGAASGGPPEVEVSDDGPGIAADRQASVFAPFVRGAERGAERGTERGGERGGDSYNLGLGLSLVARICEHQGWRVSLRSEPGAGAAFRVVLAPGDEAMDTAVGAAAG